MLGVQLGAVGWLGVQLRTVARLGVQSGAVALCSCNCIMHDAVGRPRVLVATARSCFACSKYGPPRVLASD